MALTLASGVDRLRAGSAGGVLLPGDPGYDTARSVWNGDIDRYPAVIARCLTSEEVVAAIEFGRAHGLEISVRGGGHSAAGFCVCDDGLMIDLAPMKSVRVDPVARTARAEPGVLWEEFDREAHAFGLATVGGVVGTTVSPGSPSAGGRAG